MNVGFQGLSRCTKQVKIHLDSTSLNDAARHDNATAYHAYASDAPQPRSWGGIRNFPRYDCIACFYVGMRLHVVRVPGQPTNTIDVYLAAFPAVPIILFDDGVTANRE
jgi:hypothetical protein